ncbi:chloride channel protein, partial [Reticulomyxa filosa]
KQRVKLLQLLDDSYGGQLLSDVLNDMTQCHIALLLEQELMYFVEKNDKNDKNESNHLLIFPAMNSYHRLVLHKLCERFRLKSVSYPALCASTLDSATEDTCNSRDIDVALYERKKRPDTKMVEVEYIPNESIIPKLRLIDLFVHTKIAHNPLRKKLFDEMKRRFDTFATRFKVVTDYDNNNNNNNNNNNSNNDDVYMSGSQKQCDSNTFQSLHNDYRHRNASHNLLLTTLSNHRNKNTCKIHLPDYDWDLILAKHTSTDTTNGGHDRNAEIDMQSTWSHDQFDRLCREHDDAKRAAMSQETIVVEDTEEKDPSSQTQTQTTESLVGIEHIVAIFIHSADVPHNGIPMHARTNARAQTDLVDLEWTQTLQNLKQFGTLQTVDTHRAILICVDIVDEQLLTQMNMQKKGDLVQITRFSACDPKIQQLCGFNTYDRNQDKKKRRYVMEKHAAHRMIQHALQPNKRINAQLEKTKQKQQAKVSGRPIYRPPQARLKV